MATVYRAQESEQDAEVALKVLRPYLCSDESLMERFSQEMNRVTRLRHPNILAVHGKEEEGGMHWVAMQHVSWPTLRQWLQEPIPVGEAMWILKQVVEALEAAQKEEISHGDIKPGNIFIEPETGRVLLSDFGMSILGEGASAGMRTALHTPLPTYSAPERSQGLPANMPSDIYSLGILMYDMVTGSVPFNALDPATVLARQLSSSPKPPSQVNPDIPHKLDSIIIKALAPRPRSRYETPQEFLQALGAEAPVSETFSIPLTVTERNALQHGFPGLESAEVTSLPYDGPTIICSVCGQSSPATAEWCSDCWSVLSRSGVTPDTKVLTTVERELRRKRFIKIRRRVLVSAAVFLTVYMAVQFLDLSFPLPATSSTITAESGVGEWAMVNRHLEGLSSVVGESSAFSGQVKWTFPTSAPLLSTPAIKDGRVYLTTQDGRVVALDETTGSLIWEHSNQGGIESSPAVAGNMLFYGGKNSQIMALNADTGDEVWTFETGGPVLGSPIVSQGVVYIGSGDNNLYALDAMTGKRRWGFETGNWITNAPVLSDNILVVSSLDGRVNMFDVDTGKRRFTYLGVGRAVFGSPTSVDGTVYVPFNSGMIVALNVKEKEVFLYSRYYRLRQQLYYWDITGHPGLPRGVEWAVQVPRSTLATAPSVDENNIYVSTEEGMVHAWNRFTAEKLWAYPSDSAFLTSPTVVGDVLLVGDVSGQVTAIDTSTGQERWKLKVATGSTSTPVVAGGTLYLASRDGTLYAVQ